MSPNEHLINGKDFGNNLSGSNYKNFLNQLKDDDSSETKIKTNVTSHIPEATSSPSSNFDNYIKSGKKTMKTKKNSFIKVEEFRKSKKFRENKFPTNTSFSGVDKNQIQNVGLKNYETRK